MVMVMVLFDIPIDFCCNYIL